MADKQTEVNKAKVVLEPIVQKVESELSATSDTHVNAFVYDVEQAFKQAYAALGELESKYKALRAKLGV